MLMKKQNVWLKNLETKEWKLFHNLDDALNYASISEEEFEENEVDEEEVEEYYATMFKNDKWLITEYEIGEIHPKTYFLCQGYNGSVYTPSMFYSEAKAKKQMEIEFNAAIEEENETMEDGGIEKTRIGVTDMRIYYKNGKQESWEIYELDEINKY